MEPWHAALLIRPFFALAALLVLGALVVYPIRRWMPNGPLKRILLFETNANHAQRRLRFAGAAVTWAGIIGLLVWIALLSS